MNKTIEARLEILKNRIVPPVGASEYLKGYEDALIFVLETLKKEGASV